MKKWLPWIILAVLILIGFSSYNSMVEKRNETEKSWANVESAYQRRADLIPNLVSTVKGYAAHEKETLEGVIKARASATQTKIDPTNITPANIAAFQKAQQGLSSALSRLLVTVEKYPELKANQNFLELQSQLEGTENRINVQRDRYNTTATIYKNLIQKLPNVLYASILGFKPMPLFEASAGSDVAPKVEF